MIVPEDEIVFLYSMLIVIAVGGLASFIFHMVISNFILYYVRFELYVTIITHDNIEYHFVHS